MNQGNTNNFLFYRKNQLSNVMNKMKGALSILSVIMFKLYMINIKILYVFIYLKLFIPDSASYIIEDWGSFEILGGFFKDFRFLIFGLKFLALELLLSPLKILNKFGFDVTFYNPIILTYIILIWIFFATFVLFLYKNRQNIFFKILERLNYYIWNINEFLKNNVINNIRKITFYDNIKGWLAQIKISIINILINQVRKIQKFHNLLSDNIIYKYIAGFVLITLAVFLLIPIIIILVAVALPIFYLVTVFSVSFDRINMWLHPYNKDSIIHILLSVISSYFFIFSTLKFSNKLLFDFPIYIIGLLDKLADILVYIYLRGYTGIITPLLNVLEILVVKNNNFRRPKLLKSKTDIEETVYASDFIKKSSLEHMQKEKSELVRWFLSPIINTLIKRVDVINVQGLSTETNILITHASGLLHKVLLSFLKKISYQKDGSVRQEIQNAFISLTNTIRWSEFMEYWSFGIIRDDAAVPMLYKAQYPCEVNDFTNLLGIIFGFMAPFHGKKSNLKLIYAAAESLRKGFTFYRKLAEDADIKKHGIVNGVPKNFFAALNEAIKDQLIHWGQAKDISDLLSVISDKPKVSEEKIRPDMYLADNLLKLIKTKNLFEIKKMFIVYLKQVIREKISQFKKFFAWLDKLVSLKIKHGKYFKVKYDSKTNSAVFLNDLNKKNENVENVYKHFDFDKFDFCDPYEDIRTGRVYDRLSKKYNLNNNKINKISVPQDELMLNQTFNDIEIIDKPSFKNSINTTDIEEIKNKIKKACESYLKNIKEKSKIDYNRQAIPVLEKQNLIKKQDSISINREVSTNSISIKKDVPVKIIEKGLKSYNRPIKSGHKLKIVKPEIKQVETLEKAKDITNDYVFVSSSTGSSKQNYKIR